MSKIVSNPYTEVIDIPVTTELYAVPYYKNSPVYDKLYLKVSFVTSNSYIVINFNETVKNIHIYVR